MIERNKIYLGDCMDFFRQMPDKSVDLILTDPPYGDAGTSFKGSIDGRFDGLFSKYGRIRGDSHSDCRKYDIAKSIRAGGSRSVKYENKISAWDIAPSGEVFSEIFRVSKHQIIWGGNYFKLPPARCFFVWDKKNISESFSMSMCEYAWTSFTGNAKLYRQIPQDSARFHPTQKPVGLIKWCLAQAQKHIGESFTVLDPFSGSGTTAIACRELGLDFVCIEKDPEYFRRSVERLEAAKAQTLLKL